MTTKKEIIDNVIEENSTAFREFQDDVPGALLYLVGQVMEKEGGEMEQSTAKKLIKEKAQSEEQLKE